MKSILLALALAMPAAHAQIVTQVQTSTVAPALEVQRLAPQLVAFAGGDTNFANLVNGLALGVPVTLTTPVATGGMQVVTFTPAGTMTSLQIAQLLENARQSLIARGVAAPTAQQLGATLTGGSLVTAAGATAVNGLVDTAAPTIPAVAAAGATAPTTQSPAVAIQNSTSAAGGTSSGARNTSDSPLPRGVSDTPPLPVPGVTTPAPGTAATTGTPGTGVSAAPATEPRISIPAASGGTTSRGGFGQAGR